MNNEIQEGQFTESHSSTLDKLGDIFGAWAGALFLTFLAAALLGLFFTIIPTIHFNFVIILKCFAGIWGLMFARGALKNKMF